MNLLLEHTLSIDGFANLKERRYVMDEKQFGDHRDDDANCGLGNVTYLADAFIRPQGQTQKHSHKNVDIITVLIRGRLSHQGTLGDGVVMNAGDIQIQRAGASGFDHNEINPDTDFNRLIQIWALPQQLSQEATYDSCHCGIGEKKRVYTSTSSNQEGENAITFIDILRPRTGESLVFPHDILLFSATGKIRVNEDGAAHQDIHEPALIRANNLTVHILDDAWLIAIHHSRILFSDRPAH